MIFWTIAAVCAAILAYSFLVERKAISLAKIDLCFNDLPDEFDGFTILQLADLHISHWWDLERRMEALVASVAEKVDVLALIGDIAVNSRGARLLKEFINRTLPNCKTLAVYGNTEHKGHYGEKRRADINRVEIKTLVNEHVVINRGSSSLVIAGVDDPFTDHDNLAAALNNVPNGSFIILLAHTPSRFCSQITTGEQIRQNLGGEALGGN